ncbi:MAG: efflux RND transporter permease subunit [Xanthomonadales bacterium]|nr:efflux RND transporter permease subunit [Xanthomonadales bacterium]
MPLIRLSTDNPPALLAVAALVLVFGIIGIIALPIQMLPNIEYPEININTSWRSAAPQEVEANIVEPQEEALRGIPGMVEMSSNVFAGGGNVHLTFDVGTDLQAAMIDVLNALNQAEALPADANEPEIQVGGWTSPVATLLVHPRDPAPGTDVTRFQDIIDTEVEPRLLAIEGVQRLFLRSEREEMVLISFDPYRTAALGVQVADIADTVSRAVHSTGGLASVGRRQYTVRFLGGFDLDDLGDLIVARRANQPVYLRDVAEVQTVLYPRSGFMYRTGFPAYYIQVQGKYGANTVTILDEINRAIDELNAGPLAARDLQLVLSFDASVHIRRAIALVNGNLVLGVVLALAMLWVFLRGWKATLLIALTIPFSLLTAFVALSLLGRSLNVVSLAGLAFAVGLVLDAAIIVQENIVRLRQGGMSRSRAVREGPSQVVGALFASTVTSIAIFLPILFMAGLEGQLFADLALTLSVAVAASALAAITILPVASGYLLRSTSSRDSLEAFWNRVTAGIMQLTDTAGRRALWIGGLVTLPALLTVALAPKLDFLPQADADGVEVSFSMPDGIPLSTIEDELIAEVIRRFQPHVDGQASPGIRGYNLYSYGPNASGVFIYPSDPREAPELMRLLREEILVGLPGSEAFVWRSSLLNIGISGGRNINLDLQGPDLLPLMNAARVGQDAIESQFEDWSVRALPGVSLSKPELQLVPDDIRITQAGLDRSAVADAIRAFTGGLFAGRYFDGNQARDVIVWGGGWESPEDLAGLPIATPQSGIQVVGELAPPQRSVGPTQLRRVNGQRTITLQVLPPAGITMEEALESLRADIGPVIAEALPADARIHYRGTADRLAGTVNQMGRNFVLAVLILALIMAAMFRSISDSLIVLLVMPLAVVGGVIALQVLNLFTYQALELLTMIGFIILLGLVVNNAILLVHQTRAAERDGLGRREAVTQAIRIRVRPIFMSTLTSICGMLPLMLVPGVGSEIYRGLATVIVGGMSVSAIFTLLLLPSILRLGEGRRVKEPRRPTVHQQPISAAVDQLGDMR